MNPVVSLSQERNVRLRNDAVLAAQALAADFAVVVAHCEALEEEIARLQAQVDTLQANSNGSARLLTTREAAEYLRVHPNTLSKLRMRKRGPAYSNSGGRVLYDRHDLEAYVAGKRRATKDSTR